MRIYNPTYKVIVKDYETDETLSTDWVDELDLPSYTERQRVRFVNHTISIILIPIDTIKNICYKYIQK